MVINVKMKKSLTGVLLSLILVVSSITPVVSVLAADEGSQVVEPSPASKSSSVYIDAVDPEAGEIIKRLGQVGVLAFGESKLFTAPLVDGYVVKRYHVTEGRYNSIVVAGDGASVTIHNEDTEGWSFSIVFFYEKAPSVTPPTTEQPKTEEPKVTPPSIETPQTEEPKSTEQSKSEVPKATPPASEAPKTEEQPKSETPKSTSPSTEAPKAEEPKVTPPATAKPEVTPSTAEAPKTAEQPKPEEPKTAEQKKALPNTGEAPSMLATISAILLGFVGIIGFNYKQEN